MWTVWKSTEYWLLNQRESFVIAAIITVYLSIYLMSYYLFTYLYIFKCKIKYRPLSRFFYFYFLSIFYLSISYQYIYSRFSLINIMRKHDRLNLTIWAWFLQKKSSCRFYWDSKVENNQFLIIKTWFSHSVSTL